MRSKPGTFCNKELVEYLSTRKAEEGRPRNKKLANQASEESLWEEDDEDGQYADDDFEFEDDNHNDGGGMANPQGSGKGK